MVSPPSKFDVRKVLSSVTKSLILRLNQLYYCTAKFYDCSVCEKYLEEKGGYYYSINHQFLITVSIIDVWQILELVILYIRFASLLICGFVFACL